MRKKGMMISEIPFANFPVLMKNAGLDYFIIDCEHGGFDYKDVSFIIMNAKLSGIDCIVRLADNSRKDVTKFMDMGATGLLLPMTNCAEDIAQVVRYAKYAPLGMRGISTTRAHTCYAPPPLAEYMQSANANTCIYAQIETREGLKNLNGILSAEGVYGCFFGPNDFAADCGCAGKVDSQEVLFAASEIARAASASGKSCGVITSNRSLLRHAKKEGFTEFCVGSELSAFARAAQDAAEQIASDD